jgi:hypothetical protein
MWGSDLPKMESSGVTFSSKIFRFSVWHMHGALNIDERKN